MISYERALELAIKYQAELRGWKMGDLIGKTGIRSTTFGERMKGKRPWTLEEINRISEAFGWPSAYNLLSRAEQIQTESKLLDKDGRFMPDPFETSE